MVMSMTTKTAPWSAPTITVEPVKSWCEPRYRLNAWGERECPEQRKLDGWVARVELNTHTGTLSITPNGSGRRYRFLRDQSPENFYVADLDMWSGSYRFDRNPKILAAWCQDEITQEQAQEVLDTLAPVAQRFLNALEWFPDGGWDWTLDAALTWNEMHRYAERPYCDEKMSERLMAEIDKAHEYTSLVPFEKVLEVVPEAVDPAWTLMSDAGLDQVALSWCRGSGYYGDDKSPRMLLEQYDRVTRNVEYPHAPTVVNVRAGLRRTRAKLVEAQTGYPAETAETWFTCFPDQRPDVTPDLDDKQLAELADLTHARIAHDHETVVVGLLDWLRNERARMRDLVRTEAVEMGRRTNELVAQAKQAQTARAAMAARIAGWGDPKETEDGEVNAAEIGRLVGMSRQGVAKLLAKLLAEDVEDDDAES